MRRHSRTLAVVICAFSVSAPRVLAQSPPPEVDLAVAAGRPLRVALNDRVKITRSGQPVTGTIVEPVYGWIKHVLGFRAVSMRGLAKAKGEWSLVCLVVNLRRMATLAALA